jgi:SAM-dependent methyltransferase
MLTSLVGFICRFGGLRTTFWRQLYQLLAGRYRQFDWTYMNYGYRSADPSKALRLNPEDENDRYCIQLYDFVCSTADLKDKHVLEVGSGRGGGASYIARYLRPAAVTGVDFSSNAVEFCRQRHRVDHVTFRVGRAEALPFEDGVFDDVVNVESSHCYESMTAFIKEVRRVLKPDGSFDYADFRESNYLNQWRTELASAGMQIIRETDITKNILLALDADDERKAALIGGLVPKPFINSFKQFAGMRGSLIHEGFRTGRLTYRAFLLRMNG